MTVAILLSPAGVAFAAPPVDAAAGTSPMHLMDEATMGRSRQAERDRRCIVRCNDPEKPPPGSRLQEAATKARTTVQEAREDVLEATGRAREAAGDVKEVLAEPAATSPMSAAPPAVAAAAPPASIAPVPIDQADPSAPTVAPRPDGVAGGPNTATQRTESGAIGQSKAPDAATPPGIQPEAPAAAHEPPALPALVAPPVAPPAVAAQDPSPAAEQPNSASADSTPVAESTDDLAKWSVPLAVAGAALAGLALVYPAARRQQPPIAPGQAGVAGRPGEWMSTRPANTYAPSNEPTLLTRPMRPVPNVRRNGSPVPYLRAVDSRHGTTGQASIGRIGRWREPAATS